MFAWQCTCSQADPAISLGACCSNFLLQARVSSATAGHVRPGAHHSLSAAPHSLPPAVHALPHALQAALAGHLLFAALSCPPCVQPACLAGADPAAWQLRALLQQVPARTRAGHAVRAPRPGSSRRLRPASMWVLSCRAWHRYCIAALHAALTAQPAMVPLAQLGSDSMHAAAPANAASNREGGTQLCCQVALLP